MDRFHTYLPGWEVPKSSSSNLTSHFGFITDYLAEAYHHSFKTINRYEYVSQHIKLGKDVEGRDESAIKKTICAFLKILHPLEDPTREELEEYATYAVEGRRRVKEQMHKRKPDGEFEKIHLSFFTESGEERVIFCPESKQIHEMFSRSEDQIQSKTSSSGLGMEAFANEELREEKNDPDSLQILEGEKGHNYQSLFGKKLLGATQITLFEPSLSKEEELQNLVQFCEFLVQLGNVQSLDLHTMKITSDEENQPLKKERIEEKERGKEKERVELKKLGLIKSSLVEHQIELNLHFYDELNKREIITNNGYKIQSSHGLHFYQKRNSPYQIGTFTLSLRTCKETRFDFFSLPIE